MGVAGTFPQGNVPARDGRADCSEGRAAQTNRGAAMPARMAPTSGPTIGTQA